jgi:membrane-associated phospholipid phosphatase
MTGGTDQATTDHERTPRRRPSMRDQWAAPDTRRAILALCGVFTLAAVMVAFRFDEAGRLWAEGVTGTTRDVFRALTRWGKSDWLLVPLGVAVLALHGLPRVSPARPSRDLSVFTRRVEFLFLAILVSGILAVVLKYGLGHPRPSVVDAAGPIRFSLDADYASFPSGHSTTVGALAMALALLVPWSAVVVWPFAVAVGSSRVVVGAHHVSDVVAGLGLGAWTVIALALVLAAKGRGFSPGPGALPVPERYPFARFRRDLVGFLGFCLASVRALADIRHR